MSKLTSTADNTKLRAESADSTELCNIEVAAPSADDDAVNLGYLTSRLDSLVTAKVTELTAALATKAELADYLKSADASTLYVKKSGDEMTGRLLLP